MVEAEYNLIMAGVYCADGYLCMWIRSKLMTLFKVFAFDVKFIFLLLL